MSLYVATEGFATVDERGVTVRVRAGDIAEDGNWLLARAAGSFRPLEIAFPAPARSEPAPAKSDSAARRKHAA